MVAINTLGSVHEIFSVLESSSMITNEIIDQLPNLLLVTDVNGLILKANHVTESFFNLKQKEILGKNVIDIVGANAKDFFRNFYSNKNDTSQEFWKPKSCLEEIENQFISWTVNRIKSHQEYMKEIVIILGNDTTRMINLQTSISAAQIIQKAILPITEKIPNFELSTFYQAADETGGDFYDFYYDENSNRLFFLILDVNGHGLPAALMTAVLAGSFKGIIDSLNRNLADLEIIEATCQLASSMNKSFWAVSGRAELLATMGIISIDVASGKSVFLNAAHHQVIKANKDGKLVSILEAGAPLGLEEELEYGLKEFSMESGETIFLFTDGLVENKRSPGERVTLKMIRKLINNEDSIETIKENILKLGNGAWEKNTCVDDMAFILLRKK